MTVVKDVKTGQITTKGVERLSRTYHAMWGLTGNKSVKKAVTRSIRKGTTVMRRAYREAAPNGPRKTKTTHNKMKTAARQKVRRPQKRRNAFAKVGYNVGIKGRKDTRRSHHAHFVTVGTKMRYTKAGRFTGRVKPSNRIANKVNNRVGPAIHAIETEFLTWLNSLG